MEGTAHGSFRVVKVGVVIAPIKFPSARTLGGCWPPGAGVCRTRSGACIRACDPGAFQRIHACGRVIPGSEQFTAYYAGRQLVDIPGSQGLLVAMPRLKSVTVRKDQVQGAIAVKFDIAKDRLLVYRNEALIGEIAVGIRPPMPFARSTYKAKWKPLCPSHI